MQFSTATLALASFAASAQAAMTAATMVANINAIANLSTSCNTDAMAITPFSFAVYGPKVANDFQLIISTATSDISAMTQGPSMTYSLSDQQDVCNAFRNFVVVHQTLLATVIGKHAILASTPFTAPIAAALRTLEGGVDTLAFGIINAVPGCASGATDDKNKLDGSLNQAIAVYAGVSAPAVTLSTVVTASAATVPAVAAVPVVASVPAVGTVPVAVPTYGH